jgi:broad specificity phosphatase PhoE
LTSVVIDLEQQVIPTLVISHLSILQCLIAYFRNTPVERCTSIEVPMHTIIKFTPVRGGGWCETHHPLFDSQDSQGQLHIDESESEFSITNLGDDTPIWQDSLSLQRAELVHMTMRKARG